MRLARIPIAFALALIALGASAQLLPWPAAPGGTSSSGSSNSRAFAWYGVDDTNTFGPNVTAANTYAQAVESANPGLNEVMDTASLFSYNSAGSEICYSGNSSTFKLTAAMTYILKASSGDANVWASFAVGATPISTIAGTGSDDLTFARNGGDDAVGTVKNDNIPLIVVQAATLTTNDCVRLYIACSTIDCDPVSWSGSIMIEEVTSQQAQLLGTAAVSTLTGSRSLTTDELSGGVVVKTATGAMTATLGGGNCTSGKHTTIIDAFGTGQITVDIPSGFRVEELTNSTGDDIRSSGAYGESISLLCSPNDGNGNGDLDIMVIGQKGSWVNVSP